MCQRHEPILDGPRREPVTSHIARAIGDLGSLYRCFGVRAHPFEGKLSDNC